ncbi:sugar phosphate isomerase/epimerase family protein [Glaciimonas sp. Gout2]|uniref:sugar phosphate isomerase/epimerase family protein n=1 Tax=unclassified Glaciimonas TaxID=2644401 RepID=UPI002AB34C13|nr:MULTISPECIES: sugar phosphate isomerase/epimerase family protein [unclassified Glaciimonas]MDY7545355.1 sugar phosphate isomerase/epimerase family protein [Glaciimonas sp. CA11.2]MEB0013424.1 sugar phosphate isomerase/epimerase family protein [Glaciimonas sp. Cout2]MEB0082665.1 sugar phosphate isomerase/epimerase family protein [Glaciimonas sp. Gout2]
MKISASNIAWGLEDDQEVYSKMKAEGFSALEIAPTRLVPQKPYQPENIIVAASLAAEIQNSWGFGICSMQSLWYGLTERIFGTPEERAFLLQYTCSALDFAAAVGCPHVVFGSPRNRIIEHPEQRPVGEEFFAACAAYAESKSVTIGIEANPSSYGTNYLNTTPEALELVQAINSPFFKLNLDLGTMLENEENLSTLETLIPHISHVHISEPSLAAVIDRYEHQELARRLEDGGYTGWVSLEMRNLGTETLFRSLETVAKVFNR